jgi:hypothetical protein
MLAHRPGEDGAAQATTIPKSDHFSSLSKLLHFKTLLADVIELVLLEILINGSSWSS